MASAAADWLATAASIEALADLRLDGRLVRELQAQSGGPSAITFHLPGFKTYSSPELPSCSQAAWPAISVTGAECALNCDHCRAEILKPMRPATTPEALWQAASGLARRGVGGMLLTGGSNSRNEVVYEPYLPVIRRIKDAFPHFRIAAHTGLVDRHAAQGLAGSGVDVAMLDIIGAQDTVTRVYHLKRAVADFEASLAHLAATGMRVVPHVVIGLHYGRLLGEWRALEMIAPYAPAATVLVVAMPYYASPSRPFRVPESREVGGFFLDARGLLPGVPLLLGCARPAGKVKAEIDAYGVMAGLDGIAHPAEGTVELARKTGREARLSAGCCSVGSGELLESVFAGETPAVPMPLRRFAEGR